MKLEVLHLFSPHIIYYNNTQITDIIKYKSLHIHHIITMHHPKSHVVA